MLKELGFLKIVCKNAKVYLKDKFVFTDLCVSGGVFVPFSPSLFSVKDALFLDFNNCYIFPGFIDVHVHLREPGFLYKETILSGTQAAAHGGFTSVCSMPNLNPIPDSVENLALQKEIIDKTASINVYPFASITKSQNGEELADMDELSEHVIGFSDDGKGVQSDELMEKAMRKAKENKKIISAHCEVNDLLFGGYIHDGEYAKKHHYKGISSESEWRMIERDLAFAEKTGCSYHVCHISTKESVALIREAKNRGVDVTCETAPHYLCLSDLDMLDDGKFKMNPPLRSLEDKEALIEGILDGTIDMIATDHAPHSFEEKSKGLKSSVMGVVGLETAFSVMYTNFVKTGIISLEKLMKLMHINPMKRFGIGQDIEIGGKADFTVFDLNSKYKIETNNFLSMGKSTPFENKEVYGKCMMTVCDGRVVWRENTTEK